VAGGKGAHARLSDPAPGVVAGQRPEHRAEDSGEHDKPDVELALGGHEPSERHDQFRVDRRKHILRQHQENDAETAAIGDHAREPVKQPSLLRLFGAIESWLRIESTSTR
jgi:hypothetical protein